MVAVQAQDKALEQGLYTIDTPRSGSQPPIEPGMPAETAIQLLGRRPDAETEIGAACGMLEILTWREEGTRIILSGGKVSGITQSE